MAITRLKYVLTNLIDDNSILTVTGSWGESSNFPVENIYNQRITNRAIFDTAKAGEIVIDLASAKEIDSIFIFNHNFTSSVSVSIQANSSDSWGSPPVDETITYASLDMVLEITSETYRYWRLVVDDSTRSANDIAIGEVVLGLQDELSRNFLWDFAKNTQYNNIVHETVGGNIWTYSLFKRRRWLTSFVKMSESEKDEVLDIFDNTLGGYTPFAIIFESSPYFVRCGSEFVASRPIGAEIESGFETNHPVEYTIESFELIEESKGLI